MIFLAQLDFLTQLIESEYEFYLTGVVKEEINGKNDEASAFESLAIAHEHPYPHQMNLQKFCALAWA
ncbi:hypothetical protein LYNGBM3L_60730 [Moorena producens 3L]|uniref:Uncharacterized protein n=1 Tax=Moorena producens 3L TaxID=489825 RepID=F4Y0E6_9CYAN|nr:hypothetical protein LYNGBM3L_60730 [Moorena producens 3L]OLT65259.1 hypothetical protein BI334_09595 [Moorena producens 3L]